MLLSELCFSHRHQNDFSNTRVVHDTPKRLTLFPYLVKFKLFSVGVQGSSRCCTVSLSSLSLHSSQTPNFLLLYTSWWSIHFSALPTYLLIRKCSSFVFYLLQHFLQYASQNTDLKKCSTEEKELWSMVLGNTVCQIPPSPRKLHAH